MKYAQRRITTRIIRCGCTSKEVAPRVQRHPIYVIVAAEAVSRVRVYMCFYLYACSRVRTTRRISQLYDPNEDRSGNENGYMQIITFFSLSPIINFMCNVAKFIFIYFFFSFVYTSVFVLNIFA